MVWRVLSPLSIAYCLLLHCFVGLLDLLILLTFVAAAIFRDQVYITCLMLIDVFRRMLMLSMPTPSAQQVAVALLLLLALMPACRRHVFMPLTIDDHAHARDHATVPNDSRRTKTRHACFVEVKQYVL